MPLAQLSASFQSLPQLLTIKLGFSGADSNVGGGGWFQEGTMLLAGLWVAFSHFPCYPQAIQAFLVLIPGWVGLCTF